MPTSPLDHATDCLSRANTLHALAASGGLQSSVADDLLRMALVMGVAALDTLMHQIVWRSVADHEELPSALARFTVPFERLWALAEDMKHVMRKGEKARPIVSVKTALREQLAQQTFQSYQNVGDAMAMAGVQKGWSKVATELNQTSEDVKTRLGDIVYDRNRIVHEGHHEKQDRPRTVKLVAVDAAQVKTQLVWLGKLIDAISKVASE